MALTDKQELFVREYLVDLNASAAYLRAGYKCKENVARVNASRLLTNANIQKAIDKQQQKRANKVEIDVDWVLKKYIGIIERCEQTDPQNARGALDSISKHLGMFKEKIEHSGVMGVTIVNDIPKRST